MHVIKLSIGGNCSQLVYWLQDRQQKECVVQASERRYAKCCRNGRCVGMWWTQSRNDQNHPYINFKGIIIAENAIDDSDRQIGNVADFIGLIQGLRTVWI